jgi:hypothetical protein
LGLGYLALIVVLLIILFMITGRLQLEIIPRVNFPELGTPQALIQTPQALLQTPAVLPIPPFPSVIALPPNAPTLVGPAAAPPAAAPGVLPEMSQKPQPQELASFKGCPPEGDGGDPALNRLKNRVDEGNYVPVQFDAVANLPWPKGVERRDRDRWSPQDTAAVARYEGIPISIEGYLVDTREAGPESCNCHGADAEFLDWHVWLVKSPGDDRSRSIVTETTPRVRPNHPGWTIPALDRIAQSKPRVRISGWLMFDPEHPDQVGKTRGTIWEIHPIMKIEVEQGGVWTPL